MLRAHCNACQAKAPAPLDMHSAACSPTGPTLPGHRGLHGRLEEVSFMRHLAPFCSFAHPRTPKQKCERPAWNLCRATHTSELCIALLCSQIQTRTTMRLLFSVLLILSLGLCLPFCLRLGLRARARLGTLRVGTILGVGLSLALCRLQLPQDLPEA